MLKEIQSANIVVSINGVIRSISSFDNIEFDINDLENKYIQVCQLYSTDDLSLQKEDILDEGFFETKFDGQEIVVDLIHSIPFEDTLK